MFKLPTCPYCKTVYRYKDVKEIIKNKDNKCYHCKKKIDKKLFPGILVLLLMIIIPCIVINILLLSRAKNLDILTLVMMFIFTIIFLVIGYFLIPFFVSFKKGETDKKDELRWRV